MLASTCRGEQSHESDKDIDMCHCIVQMVMPFCNFISGSNKSDVNCTLSRRNAVEQERVALSGQSCHILIFPYVLCYMCGVLVGGEEESLESEW